MLQKHPFVTFVKNRGGTILLVSYPHTTPTPPLATLERTESYLKKKYIQSLKMIPGRSIKKLVTHFHVNSEIFFFENLVLSQSVGFKQIRSQTNKLCNTLFMFNVCGEK